MIPPDIAMIRRGRTTFRGSLLLADISGFTGLTVRLALHGKKGTEELSEMLNRFFGRMYGIVRGHGGSVLSSAGDSMLVSFPEDLDPAGCAAEMMDATGEFQRLKTIAGDFRLEVKIALGYGSWCEFIAGDAAGAHVLHAGDLVDRMARAEDSAARGETVSVASDLVPVIPPCPMDSIPDEAFYIPGTESLQGEHRSITAMFVNMTGYDASDPPVETLRGLVRDISRIAGKHGGVAQMVDSMLPGGCRIFLLFGAPVSFGSDLVHGIMAGLEIRDMVRGLRGLEVSMGMDEGYAFAGVIGSPWRRHYTVIGEVVNTAARIADSADPGQLLASERVYRMSREDFDYSETGEIRPGDDERSLRLFSPGPVRSETVYRYGFVGRIRETGELLERVLSGSCLTIIEGEAGIGKTRFLKMLSGRMTERGVTVMQGTALELGRTHGLFSSLVADMAGMLEGDTPSVRKSRLWYLVHELEDSSGTLSRRESFLGRMLFSINYPDSDYDRLPPRLRRENLIDGICELILARRGPSCIILDDLHNCTDEDLETVKYICRKVLERPGSHVSLILSRRPDERGLLLSGELPVYGMTLDRLDRAAENELMMEMLGGSPLEESLENLIRERTEGNPFYLMQFLLYLVEEGMIALRSGRWERTGDYSDEKLPGSIFSMIMARVDRLEKQAKESLRIGSVVGLRFDEEIVGRVAGRKVGRSLAECTEAGLTYRSELRALEFVFSHTLIKDVTYDSMLRRRRKRIHGAIGGILEEIHRDEIDPVCPVLAHHFRTAEIWPKALEYSIISGEKAWSEYRNQDAIRHYGDALHIMEEHPGEAPGNPAECLRELGRIHDRIGSYDMALDFYDRALASSSDPDITGDVSILKADIMYTRGQVDESLQLMDGVEEMLSGSCDDPLLTIRIQCFRAWVYCVTGKTDEAMENALEAVELSESLSGLPEKDVDHRRGFAYNTLATVHWGNSDYPLAREYYQKALSIARKQDMKREMAVTSGNIGLVSQKMGMLDEAVEFFSMQHSLAMEIGEKFILLSSNGSLSTAYGSLGFIERSLEIAETYLMQAEELPAMQDILISLNQLAILNLAMGRDSMAGDFCRRALGIPGGEPYERERTSSLMIMGMVAMENGDDETAGEMFRRSEELARKLRSRSMLFNVLTANAFCRAAARDPGGVMEIVREAEGLVEEMGIATGRGRMAVLRARALLLQGRFDSSAAETDGAIAIFGRYGQRPALADALALRCRLLGLPEIIEPGRSSKLEEYSSRLRDLERETGIASGRRSAVFQVI